jgi:hypothetical protein
MISCSLRALDDQQQVGGIDSGPVGLGIWRAHLVDYQQPTFAAHRLKVGDLNFGMS